ncbi:MAG: heme ABC exporter ATP-binding protein CcmA [Silicimonas sp.]|nr:heme ABC exporter ATP-binding protein CcmA [Silicimonas sp.]
MLTLTDVTCDRGGLPILSGVSFAVAPGEAVVLRGPNGSGKTTLLRTIAGLQPAQAGIIEAQVDDIAYAAHSDGLKSPLTVAENLTFWAGLFGATSIEAALDAFELQPLRNRRAGALSAGQKRRVGLARLIVTRRRVWALDEPTVSLDTASVALFAKAVSAHLAGGGAAVIATHIDLGLDARSIDVSSFKPKASAHAFDEAFA